MRITAVSPHLDDAALSASASLSRACATVLTLFTALPAADMPVSVWDRLTGATNSLERQRERLAEDTAAMALLGASGVHLGEPEVLYRAGEPELDAAIDAMAAEMAGADEIWLPAAIGGHRDHRLARDAGLRAAAAAGHASVVLYADFPYLIAYGWPSSVSGEPPDPCLDADFWLAGQLAAAGLQGLALTPSVQRLNPAQRAVKARVIGAYRSQAAALRLAPHDLAADPGKLNFELSWRMAITAGG
jgi:LmbE family N-acetylglucosaminyl deacetylase